MHGGGGEADAEGRPRAPAIQHRTPRALELPFRPLWGGGAEGSAAKPRPLGVGVGTPAAQRGQEDTNDDGEKG